MRFCITIRGKVQGVFFRKFTQQKANELGIHGYVQNMPDGSVYCEAEGPEHALEAFTDWCAEGSPASRVQSVDVQTSALSGHHGFEIRP